MEEVCEGAKAVTAGRRSQSNALALRPLKLREPRHCLHIVHLTSHFHLYSSSSNLSTKLFHVNTPESATMAPSDEDRNSRDDTINPFIAFRRFADEQMSTIFNSVFGLHTPSSSSSPDRATKITRHGYKKQENHVTRSIEKQRRWARSWMCILGS